MNKTAVRKKRYINNNTIESLSLGRTVVQSLGNDVAKRITSEARDQFFGLNSYSEQKGYQEISGDLIEGQELIFNNARSKNQISNEGMLPALDIAPGIDYRRETLERPKKIALEDKRLIQTKVNEILSEIQKLASAQKELEVEFREVAVEQRIASPGKYHLNLFEWILSVIRLARMKIEDSGAWLAAFQSKKAKRQYWAMFKKHGTTFGLSNERVVATQTG